GAVKPPGAVQRLGPIHHCRRDGGERRARPVVYHATGADDGARLDEIDPQALTPRCERDPSGPHTLGLQRMQRSLADGAVGQAGDVIGTHAEVRQPHRDIRLAAAEARAELRRLKQALLPGRAEPQHQLAEGDRAGGRGAHAGASAGWPRASATRSISARARAVSRSQACSATSAGLTSAPPTLTATAPARIQSGALSSDTPPDGTRRRNGSGASTSRM